MRRRQPCSELGYEVLEPRRVPTSTDLTNGVLQVFGGSRDDVIDVSVSGSQLSVSGTTRTFDLADVRKVVIDAGNGNDRVTIQPSVPLSTWIFGGTGNDTLSGGSRVDRIYGGHNNDRISGGGGNDRLYGGAGSDVLLGDAGSNVACGGPGADTVDGRGEPAESACTRRAGSLSTIEQQIVDLTNRQRQANGLAPLEVNFELARAAQQHSQNMARVEEMAHELNGVTLPNPGTRIDYVGYHWTSWGENVAYNYRSATSVVTAWMNSAGHRANILNANFTQIGVGVRSSASGEPYFTQVFGRPA